MQCAALLVLHILSVFCYEYEGYGRLANVARRESIPLHELVKRRRENIVNFRRTKDIRGFDRRYEDVLREKALEDRDRLDRLHRELRWLTINSNELGIGYK